MKKVINKEHIEGRVYDHELKIKTVQNEKSANYGKEFISGNLHVAVDEEGMNVIPVHFTYVASSGKQVTTFNALKKIINEGQTWITNGKDKAMKVRVDTNLALNDFYPSYDNELVSQKVNEGGFVTIVNKICEEGIDRHKFTIDMFITSARRIEGDDPADTYVSLRGSTFNFRNEILPIDLVVRNPEGMNYFESLSISPKTPVYTKVWGKINSTTQRIKREDVSAFGETAISYSEKKVKEWVVTGVSPDNYMYGEEEVLTGEDISKAMQDREVMLAEKKKSKEEWEANKTSNAAPSAPSVNVSVSDFDF